MQLEENTGLGEKMGAGAVLNIAIRRCTGRDKDGNPIYGEWGEEETVHNLVTDTGRVRLHLQAYGSSGLSTNGFNYMALTEETGFAPAASDTSLGTDEIDDTYDLGRIQAGTITLATGTGTQTTIEHTYTFSGTSQDVTGAALFDLSSGGTMNHAAAFAATKSLSNGDQLKVTYTITLS